VLEQPLHFCLLEVTLDVMWFPSLFSLLPSSFLLSWPALEVISMVKAAPSSVHEGQELSISLSCIVKRSSPSPLLTLANMRCSHLTGLTVHGSCTSRKMNWD